MNRPVQPGEIILEHATRTFRVQADQARTLRGMLGRRRRGGRPIGPPPVTALDDVTLRIAPGETVGMVGRNGAGKTSTLKVLAGIIPLHSGRAVCGGRVVSLLELAAGFSRDFSGRENIYLQGALFGFDRRQIESRLEQIIAFSELGEFIEAPIRTYSQGMLLRLGFSIAAHLDADTMLIDEVLAVGDEGFQRKCLRRISEQIAAGATLLLVSHELGSIERVCERVIVLDHGRIAYDGPTVAGLDHYRRMTGTEHGGGRTERPSRDRAARIADLELRDGLGRVAGRFRAGSALSVHLEVELVAGAPAPRVAIELRADGGATLSHSEVAIDGAGPLSFEIPELPLLAGEYEIAAGAGEGGAPIELERSVHFSVAPEDGDVATSGPLDLRGRWQIAVRTEGRR